MRKVPRYKEVTADAGYESLENYLFLEENEQVSFIKPANYEAQKTKRFRQKIGRIENMAYDAEEDCFTCAEGRNLFLRREASELVDGYFVTTAHYRCEDCNLKKQKVFHTLDAYTLSLRTKELPQNFYILRQLL